MKFKIFLTIIALIFLIQGVSAAVPVANFTVLTIFNAPVALFETNVTTAVAGDAIRFTDLSTNSPTYWIWELTSDSSPGNSDVYYSQSFTSSSGLLHAAGNITVNLTAINAYGRNTEIKTNYIRILAAPDYSPHAQFSANQTYGNSSPTVVQFTDLSTGGSPMTYYWDMSDGGGNLTENTQQNPVWRFWDIKSYTISLTVRNAYGSNTITKTNYITVVDGSSPTPTPTPTPTGTPTPTPTITPTPTTTIPPPSGSGYGASNATGYPIGGGAGYYDIKTTGNCIVNSKNTLKTCLQSASSGQIVYVSPGVTINLDGEAPITIPAGVTLASNRGYGGSSGALITKAEGGPDWSWEEPMFEAGGNNVRVTGLRLQGEQYPQDYGNDDVYPGSISEQYYLVGIGAVSVSGFEVDNCELYGWAWSSISMRQSTSSVHNNYIHHNQARGEGYGSNLYGGYTMFQYNLYDYNRHDITGAGLTGENYTAINNIILGNGAAIGATHFDVHQDENGGNFAGSHFLISHNTFMDGRGWTYEEYWAKVPSVHIRHAPTVGTYIDQNLFLSVSTEVPNGVPIFQTNSNLRMYATNNSWVGTVYPNNNGIVWFQ